MRVLGVCPTHRLEPETRESLLAQEWDGALDVLFMRDNPYPLDDRGRANILHNYRKARRACLDGDYDAMFVVESDIIAPLDALKRLDAAGGDIAYGLYLFRDRRAEQSTSVNVFRYVATDRPDQTLSAFEDDYRKAWGTVIRCTGGGLGCALIRRAVLDKIDFRMGDTKGPHTDTHFTEDVCKARFMMMADMSVVCGHKWLDGRIVWPTAAAMKIDITQGRTDGYRGVLVDGTHPPRDKR